MTFINMIKLIFLYFILLVSLQVPILAEDLESGEEINDGCPTNNCECINDSSRGAKEVNEDESDSDSSSSGSRST